MPQVSPVEKYSGAEFFTQPLLQKIELGRPVSPGQGVLVSGVAAGEEGRGVAGVGAGQRGSRGGGGVAGLRPVISKLLIKNSSRDF